MKLNTTTISTHDILVKSSMNSGFTRVATNTDIFTESCDQGFIQDFSLGGGEIL